MVKNFLEYIKEGEQLKIPIDELQTDLSQYTPKSIIKLSKKPGNYSNLQFLLENGIDPNTTDKFGNTPIMWSTYEGLTDYVKLLIDNGADVNHVNDDGETSLIYAVYLKQLDLCKLLLKNGADINAEDHYGKTPLTIAISRNYVDLVDFLIKNGADVNYQSGKCPPAVIKTVYNNKDIIFDDEKRIDILKILKSVNADFEVVYNNSDIPTSNCMILSIRQQKNKVFDYLLDVMDLKKEQYGKNYLHFAAHNGTKHMVEKLLDKGFDIDKQDSDGNTPLYLASDNYKKDTIEYLIEKGADPTIENKDGKTIFNSYSSVTLKILNSYSIQKKILTDFPFAIHFYKDDYNKGLKLSDRLKGEFSDLDFGADLGII